MSSTEEPITGADPHRHDRVRLPVDLTDPSGGQVDHALLAQLVGAVADGCEMCAQLSLTVLAEDPVNCARMVELCCLAADRSLIALDPRESLAHGPVGGRRLLELAAVALTEGSATLAERCARMTPAQRRPMTAHATAVLIRQLLTPPGPPPP